MVNFSPGWNFSPASETNPLKIKLSITWITFFQPGLKILARFHQTGLGFSGWIAPRAEKISCNRKEISARTEKQEIIWLPDSPETLRAKFHIWCRDFVIFYVFKIQLFFEKIVHRTKSRAPVVDSGILSKRKFSLLLYLLIEQFILKLFDFLFILLVFVILTNLVLLGPCCKLMFGILDFPPSIHGPRASRLASTLRMRTAISPGQWQPWTAVSASLGLISLA